MRIFVRVWLVFLQIFAFVTALFLSSIVDILYSLGMFVAGFLAVTGLLNESWIGSFALTFLSWGWKLYIGFAIATFLIMTTFVYLNCCVGMQNFSSHLLHTSSDWLYVLGVSIFWPIGWFAVDYNLRGWGLSWLFVVLKSIEYWGIDRWQGISIEVYNFENGRKEVHRIPADGGRDNNGSVEPKN